ncbi:ANTAR domain-containing protein [Streptomyces sp. WAC 00631]|uniref:ANTAR domain-containing protein n=1 Tax=Streptomyces sp. WAC 00631 TaxID=2203201 RepID=UPI000F7B3FE8|nr:ANTAR domain-containing protein [Streptomyces sp. WAC 00631]MCC5033900.1 ANTAR domain-containing protein [Streptomyces sp. WAC 00631]
MAPFDASPSDFEAVFHATTAPLLVLTTDLVIRDANRAYASATFREREELLGQHMFDAFPDDPHDPRADGVANLSASLRRVLRGAGVDTMRVQRYPIPFRDSPSGFRDMYWSPVNSPVTDAHGEITGILHHVEDVTAFHEDLRRVERAYGQADTPTARTHSAVAQRRYAEHIEQTTDDTKRHRELEEEIAQLRQALRSRGVIDQAIGIVQAERRCNPEDAFQLLVDVSQRTNLKLRDIAGALVRLAETAPPGPLLPEYPG